MRKRKAAEADTTGMKRMSVTTGGKYRRLALIAGLVVLADQISKTIIVSCLALYTSVKVIPGFFDITFILNPGGAFGFLAGQHAGLRQFFFLGVSSLAIIFILLLYRKVDPTRRMLSAAFALILGGALGNLIDRVRFGRVVDFLDFHYASYHWPAFNVADSAITVGMIIFVYHLVFKKIPD